MLNCRISKDFLKICKNVQRSVNSYNLTPKKIVNWKRQNIFLYFSAQKVNKCTNISEQVVGVGP